MRVSNRHSGQKISRHTDLNGLFPFSMLMISLFCSPSALAAEEVEFDASFLNISKPEQLDLGRFSRGAAALPGNYPVDIWLNTELLSRDYVRVRDNSTGENELCISADLLRSLPLKTNMLKNDLSELDEKSDCLNLRELLPEATLNFDSSLQRLEISIPQIYVDNIARGSVNPALWDRGILAGILGYTLGAYSSESWGHRYNSVYASLNAGLNIGAWFLRHNGSYHWQENGEKKYDSLNTYLQRDVSALRGKILAGEANTQGQLFDTVPFTGMSLFSDDRMLPESLRGYAPEVRGIARTNALVKVRQGGSVIYETAVPPGEFVINDLYPTGYGGSLDVTIEEADGTFQTFEVPYAAVAQLLRPGSTRYSFTAGKLRNDYIGEYPFFGEATWQQGLTNNLTGYIGTQIAPDYYAGLGGVAVGTAIGAVSADVTYSNYDTSHGESVQGQSWRISYSKYIPETSSNFSLATYRFSTKNYLSLTDAMTLRAHNSWNDSLIRPRNRATLTYNQGLWEGWGQLYLSGSVQNYWGRDGHDQQYQAGYNGNIGNYAWGISTTRSRNGNGKFENSWLLNVSIPFSSYGFKTNAPTLRAQLGRDTNGKMSEQVALSGTVGSGKQFSYGLDATHHASSGNSGTVSGSYRSPWSMMSASYGKGNHYSSASAGMSGTVIAHSGGVNFSAYTGDTFALVEAKGAKGASVTTYPGIKIGANGYAVVPNLNPYQYNDISLNPKGMNDNAELLNTRQKVAPYAGAVVKLTYGVKQGYPLLYRLQQKNGNNVPFGAAIHNEQGEIVGYVGQAGQFFGQVENTSGILTTRWGDAQTGQCHFNYSVTEKRTQVNTNAETVICQ